MKVYEKEFRIVQYFELPQQIAVSEQCWYIGVRLYVTCRWSILIYCVSAINFSLTFCISFHFTVCGPKKFSEKLPKCRGLKTSEEKCIRWSGTDLRYDPFTPGRCSCVMG